MCNLRYFLNQEFTVDAKNSDLGLLFEDGATFKTYSEVPNRRADWNKQTDLEESATLLAYLLSKLINEQGGIFRLLHEKLQAGWTENLKNLSEHVFLLGTSEQKYFHKYFCFLPK